MDFEAIGHGLTVAASENQILKLRLLPYIIESMDSMTLDQIREHLKGQGIRLDLDVLNRWVEEYRYQLRLSAKRAQILAKLEKLPPFFRRIFLNPYADCDNSQKHQGSGQRKVNDDQRIHSSVPLFNGLGCDKPNLKESVAGEQSGRGSNANSV